MLSTLLTCQIAGKAVDVNTEEQVRVEGGHVEEVVEDGTQHRHSRVHNQEECQHLQRSPQRLCSR